MRYLSPAAIAALLVVASFTALARQAPAPAPNPGAAQGPPDGGRGTAAPGGRGATGTVGGVGPPPTRRAEPAPRGPDGRALLGAPPGVKGVWLPREGGAAVLVDQATVPFQPWARTLAAERVRHRLEPHARCKPSGAARQVLTPYGVEIVELPEMARIFIFDIGGPHTYRTIYLDGRPHPSRLAPSYYGHSIGRWDGDTLIVDTVGFNEGFWIDRPGTPHTEALHVVERFTRLDSRSIRYAVTIEDPGAFTRPWDAGFDLSWEDETELFEYICQQANFADTLMVGEATSVDRSSAIVP